LSRVLQGLGGFGILPLKKVSITVHHLHRSPAVAIHHFTNARSVLKQDGREAVAEVVKPDRWHHGRTSESVIT